MTRKSVGKWIDKALAVGADAALQDAYHRPKAPIITDGAAAWVAPLACSKPKQLGHAAEGEFVALPRDLDAYYPAECKIRIVLDNHSAHNSKETKAFLATRPNRFKYMFW